MANDPKKHDEISDEALDKVAGGTAGGRPDEQPADENGPVSPTSPRTLDKSDTAST